jgi:hypothetical protein
MPNDYQQQISRLQQQLETLSADYYRNNFLSSQDNNKYVRFNSRLKIPRYASDPNVGEIGEIIEVGGKLKICTSANTFTVVGTQS